MLHWQVQTCPVMNKIKHALAQKYLSYCRQISYDSIIPFNRFSIFTNCCPQISVTDMTCLLRTTHVTHVRHGVILLINKMLSKEDRVLIKVLRVEMKYGAKRIMTKFLGKTAHLLPWNTADYAVWGILQERVYRRRIRDVDHLKEQLIAEWRRFDQNIIDRAVNQWRERLCWCVRERVSNLNDQTI